MHPASSILFLIGYGLALPILFRLGSIVKKQNGLALVGHQLGLAIATTGWLLRSKPMIAAVHVAVMIAARIWFRLGQPSDN